MDKDYIYETKDSIVDETQPSGSSGNNSGMKYCPHCGRPKPASSRFCPECGKDRYGIGAGGGGYQQPQYGAMRPAYAGQPMRSPAVPVQRSGTGLAVAALIIALVNFFMFASFLSFMAVPAVLIFSIMALKRKNGGKVMAIVSIVIAIISALIFALYIVIIVKLVPDIKYFAEHDKEIVAEYELTGEAPDYFDKYRASKYDSLWKNMGYDDFDDFFGMIIDEYKKSMTKEDPDYFGKSKTKKKIKKSETTTETTTEYKRDSEDLVVLS